MTDIINHADEDHEHCSWYSRDMQFETLPWAHAIGEAEETGNRQNLLDLLRAETPMTSEARKLLADYLERGLDWSSLTDRQSRLILAAREFREHENDRRGETRDQALGRLAREYRVLPTGNTKAEGDQDQQDGKALRNLLDGKGDDAPKLRPYLQTLLRPI